MVTLQENQARGDHNAAELAESVVVEESQQSTEHLLQVLKLIKLTNVCYHKYYLCNFLINNLYD